MKRAKFYKAKVAFEIPKEYEVKGQYMTDMSLELVNKLMNLFDSVEYEEEGICNPSLLIVNHSRISKEWIKKSEQRINQVLRKWAKQHN